MRKRLFIFGYLLAWGFLFLSCGSFQKDYDILITNGTIVDGSGKPGFEGDIGISGDTIAAIGDLAGKTAQSIIDAETRVVSPGFIDMHTHCDGGLGEKESCANLNYLIQGTTTVVTGNCGGGTDKILSDLALEQKRDAFDIVAELVVEEPDLYLSCGALSEMVWSVSNRENIQALETGNCCS